MIKGIGKSSFKNPSGKTPGKVLLSIKNIKGDKKDDFINHELKRILDKKYLKVTPVENLRNDIIKYNNSYKNSLKGKEFNLLGKKDKNLIISNKDGDLELLEVSTINSRSILNHIKEGDNDCKYDSYDLRNEIMHIDYSIKSFEAFTKGEIPKGKYEAKDYLKDTNNWISKRVELQELIFNKYYSDASNMSDRLGGKNPRVICMKGNTAVGKTYTLKHMNKDILAKYPLLDDQGEPTGALNPDMLKCSIRNYDRSGSIEVNNDKCKHTISDCQAHIEGSIINDRIIRKLFKENKSLVLDKRFVNEQSIQKTVTSRMGDNYRLTIIDIGGDFEDSLKRAYNRDILSNNPIVPYEQIEDGYIQTRTNREKISKMKECEEYYLYYKGKLIAEAHNGELVRHDYYTYNNLIKLKTSGELRELRDEFKNKINNKVKNWH